MSVLRAPGGGPRSGAPPHLVVPSATTSATTPAGPAGPALAARPADALADWATLVGSTVGVPTVAVQAYGYAQLSMRASDPSCHLGWTTLAGIAEVESAHAQAGGAVLLPSGRSDPLVVGPVQDGKAGRALVADTDAGAFDGDAAHDRAMGPLHLLPSIWRGYGIDADADGIGDPYDLDDAVLTLARFLCSGDDDLDQLPGWQAALGRYHAGDAYAGAVFAAADSYGTWTQNLGST